MSSSDAIFKALSVYFQYVNERAANIKQEGHDGPVLLHWLICDIHSYETLHYLRIDLKHKTPYKD